MAEHPTSAEAWLELMRLVRRAEGTSGVNVLPGEMYLLVMMAEGGGCRGHQRSFRGSGWSLLWCGAVGVDRVECPAWAPILCGLVTYQLIFHAAVVSFASVGRRCLCAVE